MILLISYIPKYFYRVQHVIGLMVDDLGIILVKGLMTSINPTQWAVNGDNVQFYSKYDCMHWKFHERTYNTPTMNSIHQPFIVISIEWGQRWNFFKMCMYALKFYMVRLGTCLDGMGGFKHSITPSWKTWF